jgi:hypothetical protein
MVDGTPFLEKSLVEIVWKNKRSVCLKSRAA